MADRSHSRWIPDFFIEFEANLCNSSEGRAIAARHKVKLKEVESGWAVDGLTKAASKWRVANSVTGLDAAIMEPISTRSSTVVPDDAISQKLCDSYSSQLIISVSVFAFETYAHCFGRNWLQHKGYVFREPNMDLAARLRNVNGVDKLAEKIESFLERENQKQRVNEFFGGQDDFLYDICHFIRHGYAHGALQGYHCLVNIAPELKNFVLGGIRNHAESLSNECPK
ncbi:MAG: hypothetical protein ACU0BJ_14520 [Shimia sp.]|uniref:hypothetical protein n=1 Tax=Shimia sp. TaxID=1954381 RepID=UPI0040598AA4